MKPKFKPGDKVKLSVGGPNLYVEENVFDEQGLFEGFVQCSWVDNEERHSEKFPQEFLAQNVMRLM